VSSLPWSLTHTYNQSTNPDGGRLAASHQPSHRRRPSPCVPAGASAVADEALAEGAGGVPAIAPLRPRGGTSLVRQSAPPPTGTRNATSVISHQSSICSDVIATSLTSWAGCCSRTWVWRDSRVLRWQRRRERRAHGRRRETTARVRHPSEARRRRAPRSPPRAPLRAASTRRSPPESPGHLGRLRGTTDDMATTP
jgi:hypothetical protein